MKLRPSISVLILISFLFVYSCSSEKDFTIEGTVKDGEGKRIYLEHIGMNRLTTIDSVQVDKNQHFRFKGKNLTGSPDFYRIRLKNQFINVVIDSTETIQIQADTLNFAKNYTLEGSIENQKIKELTLLQIQASAEYNRIRKQYEAQAISLDESILQSEAALNAYKDKAKEYIFSDFSSSYSYFALFQQINNLLIFDPYDKDESKIFGAVANSWDFTYPDAPRTLHLVELFKDALSNIRKQSIEFDPQEIALIDAFDFTLRSPNDVEYRLSEVAKGKVLLLDFVSYELQESPAHTLLLADVYEKYANKGFEILQVSVGADLHFWKNAAINLPWYCVNDPRSTYSDLLVKFNVKAIPTGDLFNKSGEIVARIEDYNNLEKELLPLLKAD